MTQDLQKAESTEVSAFNPEEVKESQNISGQGGGNRIPFIPILEINNKTEKKLAMVDGVEQEVDVPAKKGFNVTKRLQDKKEYVKEFHEGDLNGIILKERYQIEKKYKKEDKGGLQYKSDEFDNWDEIITLYDRSDRKNIIFQGDYKQIREAYTDVVKLSDGSIQKQKDFTLFLVLYINYEASGEVYRLKIRMTQENNWFNYKNDFADNEPWAGYITHFKLEQNTRGKITYWFVTFERGEAVNLTEQLAIQKEINKFFVVASAVRRGDVKPLDDHSQENTYEQATINVDQEEDEFRVDQIPF